jgi:hypothetical protein
MGAVARAVRREPSMPSQKFVNFRVRSGQRSSPHFTCSCIRFSYALLFAEQDSLTQHQTRAMADNGSNNRDGKRKWDNGGGRGRGRGGNMQHGSRPNKKRNMGRKEHA